MRKRTNDKGVVWGEKLGEKNRRFIETFEKGKNTKR